MTLSIQDRGAIGELLGSIAVLATLVYLALQTRQNTMAIGAQLDAAVIAARQNTLLSAATSSELAEAIREDSTLDTTTNQTRLATYWVSILLAFQWQRDQARRGLLPSFNETMAAAFVGSLFTLSRSFGGWWGGVRPAFPHDFVEWVEEQRSKAA